jgi:UDP-GlcNAc:undecaprenyl-phosphate/decaprenyl-phosphate GlcNAc-1-phosphate transferase
MIVLFAFICFLTFYIFRKFAFKIDLIDLPNKRNTHKGEVPLVGGICIYILMLLAIYLFDIDDQLKSIVYIGSILIIIGIFDDYKNIKVSIRLIIQVIVSFLIAYNGFEVTNLGNFQFFGSIELGSFSLFFTIFCFVILINSYNFMDGIDSLLPSQTIVYLSVVIFFILKENNTESINHIYLILIILIIFMFFNLTQKFKIFLGDAGSTFLGLLVGCLLIFYSQINSFIPVILIPWILFIPTADFLRVTIYRMSIKRSPFAYDKNHLHYLLKDRGFGKFKILFIYALSSYLIIFLGYIIYIYLGSIYNLIILLFFFTFFYFYIYWNFSNEN